MKKQRLLTTALLAIAAAGFMAMPAKAALTYTADDLFIGFITTGNGSTFDYLINIGQASLYRDQALGSTIQLSISGIKADLDAKFGPDWSTRGDVLWGVFGGTNSAVGADPIATLYAGQPTDAADPGYLTSTQTAQASAINKITSMGNSFKLDTASVNNSKGDVQSLPKSNSFQQFQTNGNLQSFGIYTNALATIDGSGDSLNLYRMTPTAIGSEVKGSLEGTFSINGTTGTVSFTTPVPEPSTYGLVIAAATVLLVVIRRARKLRSA